MMVEEMWDNGCVVKELVQQKVSGRDVVQWIQWHHRNGTTKISEAETQDDRDDRGGGTQK